MVSGIEAKVEIRANTLTHNDKDPIPAILCAA